MQSHILSIILFTPLVGALVLLFVPQENKDAVRWIANIFALGGFLISLPLVPMFWAQRFEVTPSHFKFLAGTHNNWIPSIGAGYNLGIDGISFLLIMLTTLLGWISILSSWTAIEIRVKEYYVWFLVLQTGMLGVFMALDFFLFFVFWEAMLVPMYLLIGIWGGPRKLYAAIKFFLYTLLGSVLMLLGILFLYFHHYAVTSPHVYTFSIPELYKTAPLIPLHYAVWLFVAFFIGFAIKVPMFPFHTWLPDAHEEAPTAGSVLLAGVLLKMGTYGLLRFNLGLFPDQSQRNAPWIIVLALISIISGALVAMVQPNVKRLVAYTSVSHLGFVVLGIFSFTQIGVDGAVYQMLNHGVSTGALFMLLGMIYDRRHTYEITEYGGLATPMPVYATFFAFIMLSSVGLPLMNGFIGEFMILSGAFMAKQLYGILAATGIIWSACYLLWMYQRVFYGNVTNPANAHLPDLDARERVSLWPLAIAALVMGVAPMLWLHSIDPSVSTALKQFSSATQAAAPAATHVTQALLKVIGR